jgi:hypothetical protein
MIRPKSVYPSNPACIIVLFDLHYPGAYEQMHRLRAVWQADSDLETLDPDHMIIFLFPGADRRIAA